MKKHLFFVVFLFIFSSGFSEIITVNATTNGLWCDLIHLRAKVKAMTGKTLPFSARAEVTAMGFVKDSLSLVSTPHDALAYDTQTGTLYFDGKNLTVKCKVSTNTVIRTSTDAPVYKHFTGGIGCCCDRVDDTVSVHGPSQSSIVSTSDILVLERINTDSTEMDSTEIEETDEADDTINTCKNAKLSRQGEILTEGCLNIKARIGALKNIATHTNWKKTLPIIELSFTDSISYDYGELARYILCGSLDSLDISPQDGKEIITNKTLWPSLAIWVPDDGYSVSYVETNEDDSIEVLATYDLRVAQKAHAANLTLLAQKFDTLPLYTIMEIDSGILRPKTQTALTRTHFVSIQHTNPFERECVIADKRGPIFSVAFSARDGQLRLKDVRKNKLIDLFKKLKEKAKIRRISKVLACYIA